MAMGAQTYGSITRTEGVGTKRSCSLQSRGIDERLYRDGRGTGRSTWGKRR
jgi:hypothetical protein